MAYVTPDPVTARLTMPTEDLLTGEEMTIANDQVTWFAETFGNLVSNVEGAVLGKTGAVRLALTTLLSEGHLLSTLR